MVPFIYWGISKKRSDKFDVAAAFLCLVGIGILSLNSNLTIGYGNFLKLKVEEGLKEKIVTGGYI